MMCSVMTSVKSRKPQRNSTQRTVLNATPKDCTWEISHGISFSKTTSPLHEPSLLQKRDLEERPPIALPRQVKGGLPAATRNLGSPTGRSNERGFKAQLHHPRSTLQREGAVEENIPATATQQEPPSRHITMPGAFPVTARVVVATTTSQSLPPAINRSLSAKAASFSPAAKKSSKSTESYAAGMNILGAPVEVQGNDQVDPKRTSNDANLKPGKSITSGLWSIFGHFLPGRKDTTLSLAANTSEVQSSTAIEDAIAKKDDPKPASIVEIPPSHGPKGYFVPRKIIEKLTESMKLQQLYWRSSMYRGPADQKVIVHYCKNLEKSEEIAKMFLHDEVLGFDLEWKPNARPSDGIRKNVALVQLANEERVALFHIARFGKGDGIDDLVPPTLKLLMESPNITKVGVNVKGDCTRLRNNMKMEPRGLFELSHMHKLVQYSTGKGTCLSKRLVSLANQAEEHLGLPLWKGEVRGSDWSQDLNMEQVQYAASDSYAGLQIFYTLDAKRLALDEVPPRPAHAELNLPIRLAAGDTYETADEQDVVADSKSPEVPPSSSEAGSLSNPDSMRDLTQDIANVSINPPNTSATPRVPERPVAPKASPAPEIQAANGWVAQWRSNQPSDAKGKAYPAALRAYALWHVQGCDCITAAALLRDPPLKESSVAAYILDAIMLEGLPFDSGRTSEVTTSLPDRLQSKAKRFFKSRESHIQG